MVSTGLGSVFQTAGYAWAKVEADEILATSVFKAIFLSSLAILWILVFYLRNYILVTMAFLCIFVTEISVAGVIVLLGWKITSADCFALICPVSLSANYVLYMASAYIRRPICLLKARKSKLEQIYDSFGLPITTGTICYLILTCFLYQSEYVPFFKFGIILASTKFFSFATSIFLFGALAHIMGPEDGFGNIFCKCKLPKRFEDENKV